MPRSSVPLVRWVAVVNIVFGAGGVAKGDYVTALSLVLGLLFLSFDIHLLFEPLFEPLRLPQIEHLGGILFPDARSVSVNSPVARALALLLSHLNFIQSRDLLQHNWFVVQAPSGNYYRISPSTYYSVEKVIRSIGGDWRPVCSYCAYPVGAASGSLPIEDAMLATMLFITSNEEGFLKLANISSTDSGEEGRSRPRRQGALRLCPEEVRRNGWPAVLDWVENHHTTPLLKRMPRRFTVQGAPAIFNLYEEGERG